MQSTEENISNAKRQPVYWFVVLEAAIERGDYQVAADAARELRAMGIEVRYLRNLCGREGKPCPR